MFWDKYQTIIYFDDCHLFSVSSISDISIIGDIGVGTVLIRVTGTLKPTLNNEI
jgi:hypothetical protein